MDNKARLERLRESDWFSLFGVRKPTFEKMLGILEEAYVELHKRGGSTPRLNVLDKLVVTLGYYHDYRTMQNIAFDYGVSKSRVSDAVRWVEQTLLRDGTFSLPSKRVLARADSPVAIAVLDVTGCETQRPKKNSAAPIRARRSGIPSRTRS